MLSAGHHLHVSYWSADIFVITPYVHTASPLPQPSSLDRSKFQHLRATSMISAGHSVGCVRSPGGDPYWSATITALLHIYIPLCTFVLSLHFIMIHTMCGSTAIPTGDGMSKLIQSGTCM
jgi:hypothetical protein